MATLHDHVEDAETITDPPQGTINITGDSPSFDPSDGVPTPPAAPSVVSHTSAIASGSAITISVACPPGRDMDNYDRANFDWIVFMVAWDQSVISDVTPDNSSVAQSITHLQTQEANDGDNTVALFFKYDHTADDGPFVFNVSSGSGEMAVTAIRIRSNGVRLGINDWLGYDSFGATSTLVTSDRGTTGPALRLFGLGSASAVTFSSSDTTEIDDQHTTSWTGLGTYYEQVAATAPARHFTTSSSTPHLVAVEFIVYSVGGNETGYSGWVKLRLTETGQFQFNTLASSMVDTKMAIFTSPPALLDSDANGSLYYNDDVAFSPYWDSSPTWTKSFIPSDGSVLTMSPGTYYIVVYPYDGVDWNTAEGGVTLTIERIDVPLPPASTLAAIEYDGAAITRHVDLAQSTFEMAAGPQPGRAKIKILDVGHTMNYQTGKTVTLDIDGLRVWGGFVMAVHKGYAFPVDDTSDPVLTPRYWVLDCSDYNILFSRRAVRNKATPTDPMPFFAEGVHDDVVVGQLISDFTDLTADGIDTSKVFHVGTPAEDMEVDLTEPPDMFGDAMRQVALMPGAIYYFDADKVLNYADVDVEDAPFGLSDQPDQSTTFGYRQLELLQDGTTLGNDAMVWGSALGVSKMSFARYTNDASVTEHGLWQWADQRQDLYKPASVLKRATSFVEGSTQNNRGHKDPAISIRCVVRKPGLRAGMKVDFQSHVHGYHDVIPIRSMRIRFANPNEALYELFLAHYIDEAWNTAEFNNNPGKPGKGTRVCIQVPVDGTTACIVGGGGFSEDFDNVANNYYQVAPNPDGVTRYWSTTSWGPNFRTEGYIKHPDFSIYDLDTATSVQDGVAGLHLGDTYPSIINSLALAETNVPGPWQTDAGFLLHMRFRVTAPSVEWSFGVEDGSSFFDRWLGNVDALWDYQTSGVSSPSSVAITWNENQWYEFKWEYSKAASRNRVKYWSSGTPEPLNWLVSTGSTSINPDAGTFVYFVIQSEGFASNIGMEFDWINLCQPGLQVTLPTSAVPGSAIAYDNSGNPIATSDGGGTSVIIGSATIPPVSASIFPQHQAYTPLVTTINNGLDQTAFPPRPPTLVLTGGGTALGVEAQGNGRETTVALTPTAGVGTVRLHFALHATLDTMFGSAHPMCYTQIPFGWEIRRAAWSADFVPTYSDTQLDASGAVIASGTWAAPTTVCYPTTPSGLDPTPLITEFEHDFVVDSHGRIDLQLRISDLNASAASDWNNDDYGDGFYSVPDIKLDEYLYAHSNIYCVVTAVSYNGYAVAGCSVFDSFDRVTADGWDTSDYGLEWVYNHDTGSSVFTQTYESSMSGWPSGTLVGAIGSDSGYTGYTNGSYMHTTEGAGGPWVGSEWTMTVRFAWTNYANPLTIAIVTGGNSLGLQVGGTEIVLDQVVEDTNRTSPIAFTNNTPYYMKLHYRANSILEAKVWAVSDSEPVSYQVSGTPTHEPTSSSYLYITQPTIVGGDTLANAFEIDEIVFCGPDATTTVTVCYDTNESSQVCETPVDSGSCADTFTRSVTTGLGTSEFNGHPTWSSTSIGTNTGSVSGGVAHLPAAPFSGVDYNSYIVNGPASGDTIEYLVTFSVTGDDQTDKWGGGIVFGPAAWEPGPGTQGIELILGWGGAGSNHLTAQLNAGSLLSAGWSPFGTTDVRGQMLKTRIRLEQTDPTHALFSAKIWTAGGSEPSGWDMTRTKTFSGGAPTVPSMTKIQAFQYAISPYTSEMIIDSIEVTAGCSGSGGGYTVSQPYTAGTLTAYDADGASLGVTEIDPSAGTFSVSGGVAVRACFISIIPVVTSPIPLGTGGPVYRPHMVRQLGWGTSLDGSNCTMASACMALDRHTMGAKTATPPEMRAAQLDQVGGTSLSDAAYAWLHGFGETLSVHGSDSWTSFLAAINGKRGAIVDGIYSQVPNAYNAQPSFKGAHAIYVNEFNTSGQALVYDPLAAGPRWWPISVVQAYATAYTGTSNVSVAYTQVTS